MWVVSHIDGVASLRKANLHRLRLGSATEYSRSEPVVRLHSNPDFQPSLSAAPGSLCMPFGRVVSVIRSSTRRHFET